MNRPSNTPVLVKAKAIFPLIVLVSCILICAFRAHLSLRAMDLSSQDVFVPLDGAWRMAEGQKPHTDFYTPMGIGTYLPTLAGLLVTRGTVAGFGAGQALTGVLLVIWAFLLGRTRLSPGPLALFCLLIVFTAVGIANMGMPMFSFTPGMTYNRHCYALVMLILLEAMVLPFTMAHRRFLGGFSTGLALALLLFTKISFFLVTAALLIALLPCRNQRRERWIGIAAGYFVLTFAFAAYFHFDLRPMFGDLAMVSKAKHLNVRLYIWETIAQSAAACAILCTGAAIVLRDKRLAIAGVVITAAGVAFLLTNYEPSGFPLLALMGVIVLNQLRKQWRSSMVFIAICSAVPVILDFATDTVGLIAADVRATYKQSECVKFDGARMTGASICAVESHYADVVNDGVSLLQKHAAATDTVCSLDFANPFPFVLGLHPMQGGTTNQLYLATFNLKSYPSPERIFGSATLAMYPKAFTDTSLDGPVDQIYGAFLRANFIAADESRYWTLYRRISAPMANAQ